MKKYFMFAAAALAFAACSNEESDVTVNNSNEIKLVANMGGNVTRASNAIQSTAFLENEQINVECTPSATSTTTSVVYTASAPSGNVNTLTASSGALTWPASGTVALKAFYPSTITSETNTFTVQADQSEDANYKASDLMYATPIASQAKTSDAVGLTFKHAFSKIVVNLTAGTGMSETDIDACTVKVKAKPTVALSSGEAGDVSGEVTDITLGTGSGKAAIIVPQSYAASADFITVTTSGSHSVTYKLSAAKDIEAGMVYTYNLIVNMSAITLQSTTITNWTATDAVAGNVTL